MILTMDEMPEATDVDVWIAPLDQPSSVLVRCAASLSRSEVSRARRFATPELRRNFVVSRGAVRLLLAQYIGRGPATLEFEVGPHGKPFLRQSTLQFNVAHSGLLLTCAVTRIVPVGIDIERIRELQGMLAIARGHFARSEFERLATLSLQCRTRGFFECWTRKEAFIKATGLGMSRGLGWFEVTFGDGRESIELRTNIPSEAIEYWTLCAFCPAPDYCGAVAVRANNPKLAFHHIAWDVLANTATDDLLDFQHQLLTALA